MNALKCLLLIMLMGCGEPPNVMKDLDDTAMIYHAVNKSVISLDSSRMHGTGFQIKSPSGKMYIISNSHVCGNNEKLFARHYDDTVQVVKVLKKYAEHDLCILESAKGIKPLRLGSTPDKAEKVWIVGYPGFMPMTINNGYYMGEHNVRIDMNCLSDDPEMFRFFNQCWTEYLSGYITLPSYPGNSGSPIVNKQNKVVGVLFAVNMRFHHASYMVPVNDLIIFLEQYELSVKSKVK